MKTILFVTPCLSFAGAEKILCWLAEKFAEKKFDVHILNLQLLNNGINFEKNNLKGVKIHILNSINIRGINNIYRVVKIASLAKKVGANLLVSFTRYPCVLTSLAGKIAHIPVIISERGDPYRYSHGFRNHIEFFIMNSSDGCVFQTENAMKCYGTALQKRSTIIPNPVFSNKSILSRVEGRDRKRVISVGRFDLIQKRYDIMLMGFAEFLKTHSDYKLLLYGKGADEETIKTIVKSLKIENNVEFMGLTVNSICDMSKCEIFIITSDFEGIPNTLLEAMSIGMPVIATDCSPGGARLLIKDHYNGLLVPTGDIYGIAAALSEYASDSDLKEKCSKNAKKVKEIFEPDEIFLKWENYFNSKMV